MCLINSKKKSCNKDIDCYKLAYVKNHLSNTDFDIKTANFRTIYQNHDIVFNVEEVAELPEEEYCALSFEDGHYFNFMASTNKGLKIDGGMFHSYKKLKDAVNAANREGFYCYVIECTIPKGSLLYEGEFDNVEAYASSKIRYNKIVYKNNCGKRRKILNVKKVV